MKEAPFPNRVKELRLVLFRGELSQQDLAERAGISAGALSAIEDQRVSPKTTTAIAITRALGVTLNDVFLPSDLAAPAKDSQDADRAADDSGTPTAPSSPVLASVGGDSTTASGGPAK